MAEPINVTQLPDGHEAPQGLPAATAEHLAAIQSARGRIVFIARRADAIVGLLIGRRRRTATMLRLSHFWVDSDDTDHNAVGSELVSALEQLSLDSDILTWRIAAASGEDDIPTSLRGLAGIAAARPGATYSERRLRNDGPMASSRTPIYTQTTGFTCGSASLMMAFAGLDPSSGMDRLLELAMWREATTVVSMDGPGGCDPYGLALSATSRGYAVKVFMSTSEAILIDRGNTEAKRELMKFVQADFKTRVLDAGIKVELRAFTIGELRDTVASGSIAVVLIDQRETHGRTAPHWVVAHAVSEEHFLVNDPWFEVDALENAADVVDLPIRHAIFDRMAWYGEPAYRAALIIGPAT
ncbi:peptidase C39 family protein [Aminobacter sp. BA135]|uniref:peptidase C39 family protein n=1 Tax=Aminobacter sp. BA135 TaxID=537596 RepID=UPI003D7AAEDA